MNIAGKLLITTTTILIKITTGRGGNFNNFSNFKHVADITRRVYGKSPSRSILQIESFRKLAKLYIVIDERSLYRSIPIFPSVNDRFLLSVLRVFIIFNS